MTLPVAVEAFVTTLASCTSRDFDNDALALKTVIIKTLNRLICIPVIFKFYEGKSALE